MSGRPLLLILLGALVLTATLSGCDGKREAKSSKHDAFVAPMPKALTFPDAIALETPPEGMIASVIDASEARVWRPCHELLEEGGEPKKKLAFGSPERRAELLFGCDIEAQHVAQDGTRYYAYALAEGQRLRMPDQRISAYDAEGNLRWHQTIDRDADALNFTTSRRSSFIADIPPYLLCAGTRWDGSLDYVCIKKADGTLAWSGKLPYWSGTDPVGADKSLVFADINTIKKIYPWEGVERSSVSLTGTGGYSAFYATDGTHYLFSANRTPWMTLTSYSLETLRPEWVVNLSESVDSRWGASFAEHDLTLLKQGEEILAITTSTGEGRWRVSVGPDSPPVASSKDTIYMLVRRKQGANLLYALDPKRGTPRWYGEPPTGTLEIAYDSGALFLKSVSTVQRAWRVDEDGARPAAANP